LDILTERVAWAIAIIPVEKDLDDFKITDVDLAKKLGTNKDTLAGYRNQRGLLKGKVIDNLIARYKFDPAWLFKGVGEPFPGAREKYKEVCGPEDPVSVRDNVAGYGPPDQNVNIKDAIGKTYEVLSAGTPLSVALYMNIQQFATALDTGRALQVCQDQMKGLQSQIDMLKEQMDKLTAAPSTAEGQGDGSAKEAM